MYEWACLVHSSVESRRNNDEVSIIGEARKELSSGTQSVFSLAATGKLRGSRQLHVESTGCFYP